MKNARVIYLAGLVTTLGLGAALVGVAYVNYLTTYEPLLKLLGVGAAEAVKTLSQSVVAVDFFSLVRYFTPKDEDIVNGKKIVKESAIAKAVLFIHFLVSGMDSPLTFYWAKSWMVLNQAVSGASDNLINVMAVVIAGIVWGVQFGLLYLFGKMAESSVSGLRATSAAAPVPNGGGLFGKLFGKNAPKTPAHPMVRPQAAKPQAAPGQGGTQISSGRPAGPSRLPTNPNGSKPPVSSVPFTVKRGELPPFLQGRSAFGDEE